MINVTNLDKIKVNLNFENIYCFRGHPLKISRRWHSIWHIGSQWNASPVKTWLLGDKCLSCQLKWHFSFPLCFNSQCAQTHFQMFNFHLVNFSNNNEQKWQNVWLIQCSRKLSLQRPNCTPSRAQPRYLVLRSQKWTRHNRSNFNTHFIDSKPCKSMHLVKLKLIQGNIIPIRIFSWVLKVLMSQVAQSWSCTAALQHCSTPCAASLHSFSQPSIL